MSDCYLLIVKDEAEEEENKNIAKYVNNILEEITVNNQHDCVETKEAPRVYEDAEYLDPEFTIEDFAIDSETLKAIEERSGQKKNHKQYSCKYCNRKFMMKKNLIRHEKRYNPKTCHLCVKQKCNETLYYYHMLEHSRQKKFSCQICFKYYHRKFMLQNHLVKQHTTAMECTACPDTAFPDTTLLMRHMQTHTKEMFSCDICRKAFLVKSKLTNHMRIHYDGKAYTCSLCDKEFGTPFGLKIHLKSHASRKPSCCKRHLREWNKKNVTIVLVD